MINLRAVILLDYGSFLLMYSRQYKNSEMYFRLKQKNKLIFPSIYDMIKEI